MSAAERAPAPADGAPWRRARLGFVFWAAIAWIAALVAVAAFADVLPLPTPTDMDMLDRIENQIERFAPGFRDCILARRVFSPASIEAMDANLIGGDINGGALDLKQFFFRPTSNHYATSASDIYICSSSTPPGGGVHGMCGYHAAKAALAKLR